MLQDLERGRPMEIDALVTAVQEMGRLVDVPTPAIDIVLALVRLRARMAGCYPSIRTQFCTLTLILCEPQRPRLS